MKELKYLREDLNDFNLFKIEHEAIMTVLAQTKTRKEAAKMLGISERNLYRKVKEIHKPIEVPRLPSLDPPNGHPDILE